MRGMDHQQSGMFSYAARVRVAYGPNYDRLVALKNKHDPTKLLAALGPFREGPDLMQLRASVLGQLGDTPELLELYEKFRFAFWTLELEKDLPFLPLRDLIAFPHMVYPVFVGRPKSIKAIRSAMNRQLTIVMAAQKDPALESPNDADIYRIGVLGSLIKVADLADGTLKALIECRRRVRVSQVIDDGEFMEARTEEVTEPVTEGLDRLLESVASAFVSSGFKSQATNRSISLASRPTVGIRGQNCE